MKPTPIPFPSKPSANGETFQLMELLALRVKARRSKAGLTQEQLAQLAGLSTMTIIRLEKKVDAKKSPPDLATLMSVARGLKTSVAELLQQ